MTRPQTATASSGRGFQPRRGRWVGGLGLLLASLTAACAAPGEPETYVPAPQPADTGDLLVGAWMCPLWREGCRGGGEWEAILAYPEREPLLGWYDEGAPEVTDWEITWARNHGISFLVPCWYRARGNLGQPVQAVLEHWLRDGLFQCRYGDQMRFAILWENTNGIACGVQDEADLLDNLLPYWIETLFRRPNYLVLEGKPVLFVYSVDKFISDLGGQEEAARAVAKMREACRAAGFAGLTIIGEHHQDPDDALRPMAALGLEATSSYHWPTFAGNMPWPWEARGVMAAQQDCWRRQATASSVPAVVTVSVGWDNRPWGGKAGWQLTPAQFGELCGEARRFVEVRPGNGLDRRLLLVDNWNEFGEGHYVFPHRQYGFGYLDALREAVSSAPEPHTDPVPEDLGLGPYDSLFRASQTR
jgi:hypothetical protein